MRGHGRHPAHAWGFVQDAWCFTSLCPKHQLLALCVDSSCCCFAAQVLLADTSHAAELCSEQGGASLAEPGHCASSDGHAGSADAAGLSAEAGCNCSEAPSGPAGRKEGEAHGANAVAEAPAAAAEAGAPQLPPFDLGLPSSTEAGSLLLRPKASMIPSGIENLCPAEGHSPEVSIGAAFAPSNW
jgi:hypothetical protein